FQWKVKAGSSRIALTAGAATQLVINAAGLMAFSAQNVQSADRDYIFVFSINILLESLEGLVPLIGGHDEFAASVVKDSALAILDIAFDFALGHAQRLRDSLLHTLLLGHEFGVAAE